jgi:hypothetical protein
MKLRFLIVSVLLGLTLAGCSTVDSRIREKAAVFNQLSPADQAKIRQGIIAVGFTPDMVYMALGKPTEIRQRTRPGGQETLWIYNTYYDRYEGTVRAGYRRWVVWEPRIRAYRIYYEPVYGQVYSEQKQTDFRITFLNGRVTVIEETK